MPDDHDDALPAATASLNATMEPAVLVASATVRTPIPRGHRIHQQVGEVTTACALIEHVLDRMIWRMAGLRDAVGSCLTARLSEPRPRLQAIEALNKLRLASEQLPAQDIKDLMSKLQHPFDERNRLVHDVWVLDAPDARQIRPASGSAAYGARVIDDAQIEIVLERLQKRLEDCERLLLML